MKLDKPAVKGEEALSHVQGETDECVRSQVRKLNIGAVDIIRCLEMLIEAGARVNDSAKNGETALHLCASEGNADAVNVLVKAGADVNMPNKDGIYYLIDGGIRKW